MHRHGATRDRPRQPYRAFWAPIRRRTSNDFGRTKLPTFVLGTASANRSTRSWRLDCKLPWQRFDKGTTLRGGIMIESQDQGPFRGFSRRSMIGIGSTLATAALAGVAANAQTRGNTRTAEHDPSASNPGPENTALLNENPNSNTPPPTDNGDVGPIWYSFDLTHKRIQEGGGLIRSRNENCRPPRTLLARTCA
jgi:hypothetical protein